ncbi:MAG: helix-turn-helix transcriptional regulator, partial [Saprospiraceae bacterium]
YAHATQCQPAAPQPAVVLSERERECLLWTARGKSSWEISVIVGLSENTVSSYLKNAMKKLGTTNRVLAVVQAIKDGLIHP